MHTQVVLSYVYLLDQQRLGSPGINYHRILATIRSDRTFDYGELIARVYFVVFERDAITLFDRTVNFPEVINRSVRTLYDLYRVGPIRRFGQQ